MTTVDVEKISALIRDCAARLILPRFNTLKPGDIDTKSGPNDLVTIADRETEAALDAALTAMYPGCAVIGEEGIAAGTKSIDTLQDRNRMIWIADPVDGTHNFVHGKREFAVMLACVIDGVTHYGWIYDVPGDRMLFAAKGQGTFLDGVRQHVAAPKPLAQCRGFAGTHHFEHAHRPQLKTFTAGVESLHNISCAGHEYLSMATGLYDFSFYSRIRAWDHLPGALAVQEAGGVVTKWDGSSYEASDELGGLIVASNPELLATLQEKLIKYLTWPPATTPPSSPTPHPQS